MHREKGQIRLEEVLKKTDVCLPIDATFRELLVKMNNNTGGVIVILQDRKAAGIITERDIVQMMYHNVDMEDGIYFHAQKKLVQASSKRCISYGMSMMLENNIRRLIVTNNDGTYLGVLTQKELLEYMEEVFGQTAIRVGHVMADQPELISVDKSVSIRSVLHLFMQHKISSVPVLEQNKAVGIITEKDILKLATNEISMDQEVANYMSFPVFCADTVAPVVEIVHEMNIRKIRRVVVNDDNDEAVAVLTNRDFARNLDGDYNHLLKLKLKYTKEILNLLPEMLIELVDLGDEQLVIWANEKSLSNFGTRFLDKPVTELIPSSRWKEIYSYLCDNDKIAEVRFERDGKIYEFSGYYLPIEKSDEKGRIQLIVRDITEEVVLATIDPLTNIYNRRHITDILAKETERSRRFSNAFSIVMIDIDDFKEVNDQHGHIIGDLALKAFAGGVKEKLREYDVLGRYGGEEFLLILPELGPDKTFDVVDRIRNHIQHMAIEMGNGLTLHITSSFGVACFPRDAANSIELLLKADERLYEAKRTGKNKVIV